MIPKLTNLLRLLRRWPNLYQFKRRFVPCLKRIRWAYKPRTKRYTSIIEFCRRPKKAMKSNKRRSCIREAVDDYNRATKSWIVMSFTTTEKEKVLSYSQLNQTNLQLTKATSKCKTTNQSFSLDYTWQKATRNIHLDRKDEETFYQLFKLCIIFRLKFIFF